MSPLMAFTLSFSNVLIYKLAKKGYIHDNYILIFDNLSAP
jgi:general stress protein CsbA